MLHGEGQVSLALQFNEGVSYFDAFGRRDLLVSMRSVGETSGLDYRKARACPSPGLSRAERSRGTGPRATVIRPHRRARACPSPCTIAGDRPPRYGVRDFFIIVGRGPVPRHAAVYRKLAGETRSDARMASEGPRATVKKRRPLP